MAKLSLCGGRAAVTAGSRLLASGLGAVAGGERYTNNFFLYDCSSAEKKLPDHKDEDGLAMAVGSDTILAHAFSSSGSFFALTDDNKRLILFRTVPSWQCLSVRSVARRCTALVITTAEDRIFVADKSGDVYSFSVTDPQGEARLELGHLSMLLHLAVSPDDQYIITADRDEKVRVSLLAAPHNIVSFCLGHTEFVSQLLVLPWAPDLLVSSSGDQTIKLWEYVTGREVQSCDLSTSHRQDGDEDKRFAVSRIAASCSGSHIAVLFDCVPTVHVFQFDAASRQLLPGQEISLEHGVWDVAFDASSGLWILQEDKDEVVLIYRLADGKWQRSLNEESMERLSNHLRDNWTLMEGCSDTESPFRNLYKASYDNMAHYLQKKEERILEQKQKKRKGAQQETTQQTKVLHPVTPSS
ncbi:tRNA (guanine-N(7)-)-methyltransferase non-catalytic subunit WDR4 isoform X2 [Ambystoma mexicanum]|uniref:tRNA (guanine-N(7)-)-methyltransferase non-catalytic subunit WDR4 isoform X2 n=1 Tax=Ambystoma mexicanum TaxID=8296 RepID=UPI0037E81A65